MRWLDILIKVSMQSRRIRLCSTHSHGEIFDVDMSCSRCRFLCIAHSGASIVVFVKESSSFLGNVEVSEYAPDKQYHVTSVVRGHKFSFGR